jgi:hypothetical protein
MSGDSDAIIAQLEEEEKKWLQQMKEARFLAAFP